MQWRTLDFWTPMRSLPMGCRKKRHMDSSYKTVTNELGFQTKRFRIFNFYNKPNNCWHLVLISHLLFSKFYFLLPNHLLLFLHSSSETKFLYHINEMVGKPDSYTRQVDFSERASHSPKRLVVTIYD